MTLSLEFKWPIPVPEVGKFADRTVGLYTSGTFISDPQARHEMYVEVWSAPTNIGEGEEVEGWRDNQRCLATLTQMALTVPMEVNRIKAKANL
jgi:hypothetical protein